MDDAFDCQRTTCSAMHENGVATRNDPSACNVTGRDDAHSTSLLAKDRRASI
jgi:hypothetical protein